MASGKRRIGYAVLSFISGSADTDIVDTRARGALRILAGTGPDHDTRAFTERAQIQAAAITAKAAFAQEGPPAPASARIALLALICRVLRTVGVGDAIDDTSIEAGALETDAVRALVQRESSAALKADPVATCQARVARGITDRSGADAAIANQRAAALVIDYAFRPGSGAFSYIAGVLEAITVAFIIGDNDFPGMSIGNTLAVDAIDARCEIAKVTAIRGHRALDAVIGHVTEERTGTEANAERFVADLVLRALGAVAGGGATGGRRTAISATGAGLGTDTAFAAALLVTIATAVISAWPCGRRGHNDGATVGGANFPRFTTCQIATDASITLGRRSAHGAIAKVRTLALPRFRITCPIAEAVREERR